jgi:hypothetical protein
MSMRSAGKSVSKFAGHSTPPTTENATAASIGDLPENRRSAKPFTRIPAWQCGSGALVVFVASITIGYCSYLVGG